jgi:glycerol-3-phosphate dehydrogenase
MGQDTVDRAARIAGLPERPSVTESLRLHGWTETASPASERTDYGADEPAVDRLAAERPGWGELLHPRLPYRICEVVWAARHEMARTVEDVLARRTRALFLDARASLDAAPAVARLLAAELGRGEDWAEAQVAAYGEMARGYTLTD